METSGLKEYLGYQNHNFRWGHLLSAFSQSISIYWVDEGKGFLNKEISKTGIVLAPTGCQWFVLRNKPFCKIILSCNNRVWTVQLLTLVWLFVTPSTVARQASLSITNFWNLFKRMPNKLVMPSNHFILCCPLLLLPSIFPSIRVFSNESVLYIRWPKYWSFSFNISPSNKYSGL